MTTFLWNRDRKEEGEYKEKSSPFEGKLFSWSQKLVMGESWTKFEMNLLNRQKGEGQVEEINISIPTALFW